jgi:hypothetical protein
MQRVAKIIASYGQCTKAQAEVLIQEVTDQSHGTQILIATLGPSKSERRSYYSSADASPY